MARIFTLGELVTMGQQRADMENSDFVSAAEWRSFFSAGYAVLYSVLVESGMRYFETAEQYTASASPWNLPDDFLTTVGVDYLQDGTTTGTRYQLREMMAQERNKYAGTSGTAIDYAIVGNVLKLYPTPTTGQVYEHIYVPQPSKLTDDDDSIDVVTPDGEQFLLWYAVFLARDKEDSDVRSALRERSEALDRLRNWAQLRSLHVPRRSIVEQDIDGGDYYDPAEVWWNR